MEKSSARLDRGSPMPLWAQLLADLRLRLRTGEWGDRFPTDAELTEQYAVSRHTVREAVRHLRTEGILERQRGKPSVVRTGFEQPLGSLYSLFRSVEATGVEQRSEVLSLDVRTDPEVAAQLDLAEAEPLVYLERLRLAGEQPLAFDCAWLPAEVASPLLDADFAHTALYDELASRCGVELVGGEERIRPVVPDRRERKLLGLGAGEAVFSIERRTHDGRRPVEWRRSLVRGDRYSFVASWSGGSGYTPTLAPAGRTASA
ncbi:MAG: GntR family transcriptional regulator [Actinomycetota bacterium]|nr:GntR family transcriptional regulator [Actinomycetota bacterium]